ncbi:MAG: type IV secretion protein IcmL [Alphaproteobacteria bacterium]|nr:type IV secretion protein IcmL [Alphaproteobacteria bacterium]|tara:strand:+ start:29730 stop:30404 length:675 start_codon:yes stop_codon:yes gene_type:complete
MAKENIDTNLQQSAPGKPVSGLGTVVVRNEFYRDGYRSLLKLVILLSLIIGILVLAILGIINSRQPENRYFATTEDGRLIPMVALNQPNLSTPALLSWVAQAATEVMTFGFNDYRRRLQESSRNFTRTGWESFTTALNQSGIISTIEQRRQVVTAVPAGAPILESEAVVAGRYQWVVQIPMKLSYQTGAERRTRSILVRIVVVRVPRLESSNGVGIDQWIATAN